MKLVFATNNRHKLEEIKALLNEDIELLNLQDIEYFDEIIESGSTLEENADIKSSCIWDKFKMNVFSDDTGLEIEALNGEPGVYSARYAGEDCSFDDNMNKVLANLKKESNRKARFRTIISLILNGETYHFEGIVDGEILTKKQGEKGFGYDPIFKANSHSVSFAEMSADEKNQISHRGLAVQKLIEFLNKL